MVALALKGFDVNGLGLGGLGLGLGVGGHDPGYVDLGLWPCFALA